MSRKRRLTNHGKRQNERNSSFAFNQYEEEEEAVDSEKPYVPQYAPPKAITHNHKLYKNMCEDPDTYIVLCDGWAGTGKSIRAVYSACQAVLDGKSKGIYIMRSLEGLGRHPGAYTGDALQKNLPKLKQLLSYAAAFLGCDWKTLVANETVIIQGLNDVQGMDMNGYWLIVTEAQTLTAEEMYAVVTRGADKIILEGDTCPAQMSNHRIPIGYDGLSFLMRTLGDLRFVGRVTMDKKQDIVRKQQLKEIITRMMPALEEMRVKKN